MQKDFASIVWILVIGFSQTAVSAPPDFRKPVSGEQIVKAAADSGIDDMLAAFAADKGAFPESGAYITYAPPGSPFEKLGIPLGSVIERSRSFRFLPHPLRIEVDRASLGNGADKVVWVTPDNERREVSVPPDVLGFRYSGFRNLPNWYLRHGQRGKKWDRWVVLALSQQGIDPALAETCWAAALHQGYRPDKLSSWSGMLLALAGGEFDRAAVFAESVAPFEYSSKPSDFPLTPNDIHRLVYLTGDPRWYTKAGGSLLADSSYTRHLPNFRHQIALAEAVPAGTPAPSVLADGMKRESFLMKANTSPVPWSPNSSKGVRLHEVAAVAQNKGEEGFPGTRLEASPGHFVLYFFSSSEPARDVDMEIKFMAEPFPAAHPPDRPFHRLFAAGLADRTPGKIMSYGPPADTRLLVANLSFDICDPLTKPHWEIRTNDTSSQASLPVFSGLGGEPSTLLMPTSPPYRHDPKHVHTLRIVRVGAQAEALLDGRRLALVPVPMDLKDTGVFFNVIGSKVTVTSLKADILK